MTQGEQDGRRGSFRGLMAAVIAMGVLIVLGVAVVAVTIVRRLAAPAAQAAAPLNEPEGTRIQSVAATGDRLAIVLTGGGPDRIVLLDPKSGQVTGRIGISR